MQTHPPADAHAADVARSDADIITRLHRLGITPAPTLPARQQAHAMTLLEANAAIEELVVTEEELRTVSEQLTDNQCALEDSRSRYQDLFDSAPDAYYITDVKGIVTDANRAVSQLIGYSRIYLLNKPIMATVHPDSAALFAAKLQALQTATDSKPRAWEMRMKPRRSSTPTDVSVRARPVLNASGRVTEIRWMMRDITVQQARVRELERIRADAEKRLRTRTMELEAVVRMRDLALADSEAGRARLTASLRRIIADATVEREGGVDAESALTHVLDSLRQACDG